MSLQCIEAQFTCINYLILVPKIIQHCQLFNPTHDFFKQYQRSSSGNFHCDSRCREPWRCGRDDRSHSCLFVLKDSLPRDEQRISLARKDQRKVASTHFKSALKLESSSRLKSFRGYETEKLSWKLKGQE